MSMLSSSMMNPVSKSKGGVGRWCVCCCWWDVHLCVHFDCLGCLRWGINKGFVKQWHRPGVKGHSNIMRALRLLVEYSISVMFASCLISRFSRIAFFSQNLKHPKFKFNNNSTRKSPFLRYEEHAKIIISKIGKHLDARNISFVQYKIDDVNVIYLIYDLLFSWNKVNNHFAYV